MTHGRRGVDYAALEAGHIALEVGHMSLKNVNINIVQLVIADSASYRNRIMQREPEVLILCPTLRQLFCKLLVVFGKENHRYDTIYLHALTVLGSRIQPALE